MVDKVEAQRNLKRYKENIHHASQIHPQDLNNDQIAQIAIFIRDQKKRINVINELLDEN